MDNLAHSLVGLTSAKAGLERLSPYATVVCVVSANAADADSFSLLFGDRWTLLQHHRGITHSIAGTIVIGLLIPLMAVAIERIASKLHRGQTRIRFRGLLIASLVAAGTHPLMDWTNNYGIRPLLPWSGKWFYGDLVFIMDPYVWLVLGGVGFLLTSTTRFRTICWAVLGSFVSALIILVARRSGGNSNALIVATNIWITGILGLVALRFFGALKYLNRLSAIAALGLVALYWCGLALMHRAAYANTLAIAEHTAARRGENLMRAVAMPNVATPFRWQSVAETDRAMYRFSVSVNQGGHDPASDLIVRFEKPTGKAAELVSLAEADRRAQALLGFARFPIAQLADSDCVSHTLVQFADLRYTEPGVGRGNFSVNVPVDCAPR